MYDTHLYFVLSCVCVKSGYKQCIKHVLYIQSLTFMTNLNLKI